MNRRLRVLQIGKFYAPFRGGMETHLQLLCEGLRPHVDLEVLVSNVRARTEREEIGGVEVTRCLSLGAVSSTSMNPTLPVELSRRSYDVLHVHVPNPMAALAYFASVRPRAHRLIVTHHSDVVRQKRLRAFVAPMMRRLLARADAIVCASEAHLRTSQELRAYRDRCRVIPFGIDTRRYQAPELAERARAVRARYPRPVVLCVGRLIYYKGFEYAIEAVAELDCELVVVGEGPLRPALEARARALRIAHRVHLLGELDQESLDAHYAAADVFVLPSVARSEAFGLVQLEAMALGVPIINTALDSAVPEVSRHGETGITVPPANAGALRDALRTLLADSGRRKALGAMGRERVRTAFSQERMTSEVLALYRSVSEAIAA